ncbi:MAG: hypothetical protein WCC06_06840 [Candidatus Aminicenantales bacterium]
MIGQKKFKTQSSLPTLSIKKKNHLKYYPIMGLSILSLFILTQCLTAITITLWGSWTETINSSDLLGPPGSDLNPSYESSATQVTLNLRNTQNRNWEVDVRKVDSTWNPLLHLYLRRTSDGNGRGWISGGTPNYLEVTDSYDSRFIWGRDNRTEIYLQFKVDGVSVAIPPNVYTTTIYYTAIEVF